MFRQYVTWCSCVLLSLVLSSTAVGQAYEVLVDFDDIHVATPPWPLPMLGVHTLEGDTAYCIVRGKIYDAPDDDDNIWGSQITKVESIDGTVTIDAPETDLSGVVVELSEELLDASERLAAQCNARGGRTLATFVGRGRSGLPQQPGDPVVALYAAPGRADPGGERVAMLPGRLEITCEG